MKTKRKTETSRAAQTLSALGVEARKKRFTKKQRSEQARDAAKARWRPQKGRPVAPPVRWYGLFDEANINAPELVAFSQNKMELRERSRSEDRDWVIEVLDYDPRKRVTIIPEFTNETEACVAVVRDIQEMQQAGQPKGRRK
jgi:hypothetical protein